MQVSASGIDIRVRRDSVGSGKDSRVKVGGNPDDLPLVRRGVPSSSESRCIWWRTVAIGAGLWFFILVDTVLVLPVPVGSRSHAIGECWSGVPPVLVCLLVERFEGDALPVNPRRERRELGIRQTLIILARLTRPFVEERTSFAVQFGQGHPDPDPRVVINSVSAIGDVPKGLPDFRTLVPCGCPGRSGARTPCLGPWLFLRGVGFAVHGDQW